MTMSQQERFERFQLSPLTGSVGAEVHGVDLAADIDDATQDDLARALAVHHVLAIRDQRLEPASFHKAARRFGPFSGNPVHVPIEGYEDIVRFVREADETGPVIGENWHMDLSWMERPPAATMLYGEVLPPVGGDTLFATLEAAWDGLSPKMQTLLEGLVGVHCAKGVFAANAKHKHLGVRPVDREVEEIETEHPLVCTHPRTGRRRLFISGVLRRFKGMTEAESRPIIDFLLTHAVRPEYTCRLRWAQGTVGIWANTCLLHTAINDYAGYRRVMYRTTVAGPRPH
jgi:taurine dioxygenase